LSPVTSSDVFPPLQLRVSGIRVDKNVTIDKHNMWWRQFV